MERRLCSLSLAVPGILRRLSGRVHSAPPVPDKKKGLFLTVLFLYFTANAA